MKTKKDGCLDMQHMLYTALHLIISKLNCIKLQAELLDNTFTIQTSHCHFLNPFLILSTKIYTLM